MYSVYKKEMYLYFSSPIFYTVAFIFVLINGFFFYNNIAYFSMMAARMAQYQMSAGVGVSEMVVSPLLREMGMIILFILPILTMRLYSEEKAHGTIELMFTYPLRDIEILLGKFFASLSVVTIIFLITLIFVSLLGFMTTLDWGIVFSCYLGLILMASSFLSLGIFASSLTKSQVIAAISAFGLILIFWIVGWFATVIPNTVPGKVLQELSLLSHLDSFLQGMINLKDMAFYVFFSAFFLFVTLRTLESHTWRG
jgi:ABC-2 type transport system permease protein